MRLFFATILATLFAVIGPAFADVPPPSSYAPPGSYHRTCTDIHVDWNVLSASCRTRNGDWNFTTLRDYRNCEGDIANINLDVTAGRVALHVCADPDGRLVGEPKVVKSSGSERLDGAAQKWAQAARWVPATANRRTVEGCTEITAQFRP